MSGRGHVPQRMCCGCGGRFAKSELVRFTLSGSGEGPVRITVDAGGSSGRGAYVCRRLECFDAAAGKRRSLQRRLVMAPLESGLRERFVCLISGEQLP